MEAVPAKSATGSRNDVREHVVEFLDSLKESEKVYRRLIELTREQSGVLRSGDTDELMRIARLKESQMARLESVERRMHVTRATWNTNQGDMSRAERRAVEEAVGRVEGVLRDLLTLEKEQEQAIVGQREETLAGIQRLEAGRRVQRAYTAPAPEGERFLDHKE